MKKQKTNKSASLLDLLELAIQKAFPDTKINYMKGYDALFHFSPERFLLFDVVLSNNKLSINTYRLLPYIKSDSSVIDNTLFEGEITEKDMDSISFILKNYKSVGRSFETFCKRNDINL